MMASLSSSRPKETENEHLETPQTHSAPQSREEGSESGNEDKDENVVVVGRPLPECKNKAPPPFFGFWNPISYILFLWYGPILKRGYKHTLEYDDVFDTPALLKTKRVYSKFAAHFESIVKGSKQNVLEQARDGKVGRFIFLSIWRQHRYRIIFAMILQLTYSGIQFVGPLMLNEIVKILTKSDVLEFTNQDISQSQVTKAFLFAMGMFLAPVVGSLGAAQANRVAIGTQIMIRAELNASIYRKALRLSTRSRQATETGRIVNLMSADVNQLQSFFYPFASQILTGPIVLITALILLWFQIRWATFIGLAILLISTPATTIFLKKITQYRRQMLKYTDQRVKLMNQLLVGIRVLKMYAWEAAQEAALLEVRKSELRELRKAVPMRVGMQTLLFAAPTLAMVTCFVVYGTVEPDSFTPANIFTSISLFALMRFPLIFLPFALVQLANAFVSMRRLTQYFLLEDRDDSVVEKIKEPGIEITDGNFFWAEPPPKLVMPEISKKKNKNKKHKKDEGGTGKDAGTAMGKSDIAAKAANGHAKDDHDPHANDSKKLEGRYHLSDEDAKDTDGSSGDEVAVSLPSMATENPGHNTGEGVAWRLNNINLTVRPGELVCVVGRVGSGKSSLVQAILGEMNKSSGRVAVGGTIAYAAQQPWIINANVKENVSFGKPFDEKRWQDCVQACCLESDLEVLPAGADTEIGEKGINLSGGQKQRVSLARSLYQDADVYILDDPLSAVDVHVGKHIFSNFIDGAIKNKARLLVTNQLQYLPSADHIIALDDGHVIIQGTYDECLQNEAFARLISEHNSQVDTEEMEKDSVDEVIRRSIDKQRPIQDEKKLQDRELTDMVSQTPGLLGKSGVAEAKMSRTDTFVRTHSNFNYLTDKSQNDDEKNRKFKNNKESGEYGIQLKRFETMRAAVELKQESDKGPKSKQQASDEKLEGEQKRGALIAKEDKEVGHVTGKVYLRYIAAYGWLSFLALAGFWSCEQSVRILTNWYLSKWTSKEVESTNTGQDFNRNEYIGGYVGLALGFVALTGMRSLLNLLSAVRASRIIHYKSLTNLVRAPVLFFDTTPVGRILNRFSKDTDEVDFLLSMSMTEFGNCIMQLLATLIFLAVVQPIILAGIVPLMLIYYLLQHYYRRSYIEMQRLDAVSRSPIYSHFSESLAGIDTIRAFQLADAFAATSDARVDANHRAYFTLRMANEWLSMRLDAIGATIVFLTAVLAIVRRDSISASLAALTLSEALDVTLFLKAAVTSGAMFETRFNSVERLSAYWELPQEADKESSPDSKPPDDWPYNGQIEYRDVWMRYRQDLDPVLKGVSFTVSAGDKIGIVGRTGSGKSSLIVTLFRLTEPYAGNIVLDGIDILTLGLNDVRSRIAAIPQDPVLFSGTVRTNLDPYSKHSDAELWDALGHVALREVIAKLPEGLSSRVAEGGENFSVGQRQLLCVGRALLRNPRVLVADEATASVDSETDALIQKTIRREFKDCTVLTIAHRINTILDSTKVLVMEDGIVKEFASVPSLMSRQGSSFRAMVVEAGLEGSAMSRGASGLTLNAMENDGDRDKRSRLRPEGLNTFVKRIQKENDLK